MAIDHEVGGVGQLETSVAEARPRTLTGCEVQSLKEFMIANYGNQANQGRLPPTFGEVLADYEHRGPGLRYLQHDRTGREAHFAECSDLYDQLKSNNMGVPK